MKFAKGSPSDSPLAFVAIFATVAVGEGRVEQGLRVGGRSLGTNVTAVFAPPRLCNLVLCPVI